MGQKSSIEWTESTWNPLTGCAKISPGCQHCYAERMSYRLQKMGQPNYANGFTLTLHSQALEIPLRWKKPQTISHSPSFTLSIVTCLGAWSCGSICEARSIGPDTIVGKKATKRAKSKMFFVLPLKSPWPISVNMTTMCTRNVLKLYITFSNIIM